MVHLDLGTAFRLNGTARLMWNLAAQGRTADEIAGSLADHLTAPVELLRADAAALIGELASEALLEPTGDEP
ncbi:MAG TPA: PqqD family protein [Anaeromyxobacteraceae bacterium]|nr:PqqD family protein [Anaeromyxobacteraceae bacterium]